jgi:hypothetical protein
MIVTFGYTTIEEVETRIREVLHAFQGTIISRDNILERLGVTLPRKVHGDGKRPEYIRLRQMITNIMKKICLEGVWEVQGSLCNPRWARVR